MKNIHVLPTDKPSRLYLIKSNNKLGITSNNPEFTENFGSGTQNQNIYITNSEEIKDGDWCIHPTTLNISKHQYKDNNLTRGWSKIILTTDLKLIAEGVQAIDDEFLEWFVKNPSCEEVEVEYSYIAIKISKPSPKIYKIIIPKEEPKIISNWLEQNRNPEIDKQVEKEAEQLSKQETLEEAIKRLRGFYVDSAFRGFSEGFKDGAKWQAERMYSEEEALRMLVLFRVYFMLDIKKEDIIKWFERFKKK
jgi:hypothetical protein